MQIMSPGLRNVLGYFIGLELYLYVMYVLRRMNSLYNIDKDKKRSKDGTRPISTQNHSVFRKSQSMR
jgi:hypothetical protein